MSQSNMRPIKFSEKLSNKDFVKALIILFVGIIITISSTLFTYFDIKNQKKNEFSLVCSELKSKIDVRLHANAQLLRDGSSFFAASDSVTRNEWKDYVEHSKLDRNLPGVLGVGYSFIIPKNQLKKHIQSVRDEGFHDYTVKPEGTREIYTSIIYLEPFTKRNQRAFGYDMYSEPVRMRAMNQACDSDVAALSGKVTLVQESDKDVQAGTLMYVPVYRNGMSTSTLEERRKAIIGWIYSPYRMTDLMNGILGLWDSNEINRIHLKIYDNDMLSEETLLFDSQQNEIQKNGSVPVMNCSLPLIFNGKKWNLYFSQTLEYSWYFYNKVFIVLFAGILVSILLTGLFISLTKAKKRTKLAEYLSIELKASEEKFHSLYSNMSEGAALHEIIYDSNGAPSDYRIIETNQAFDHIIGIPRENVIGKTSREAYSVDEPPFFDIYTKVATSGVSHNFETYFEPLKKYFTISVYCPYVGSFATIFKDITESKLAEKAIKESEEKYRLLLENSGIGVGVYSLDGVTQLLNPKALQNMGGNLEDYVGKSLQEIFGPEAGAIYTTRIQNAIQSELNEEYEDCVPLESGNRWFLSNYSVIKNMEGKTTNIQILSHDITERKLAEAKLQQSEELYRTIINASPDNIAITDMNGKILLASPSAYKMYGYSFEDQDVLGHLASDFIAPEDRSRAESDIKMLINGIKTGPNEYHGLRKNGERINVEVKGEFIRDVNGFPVKILIITHDITARKKAELELRNSEKKFKDLFEANTDGITIFRLMPGELPSTIIAMNENAAKMVGYTKEEMLLMKPNDFEKDITPEKMELRKYEILTKGFSNFETILIHKNGSEITVEIKVSLINYDNQPALMNIVRDITARKQTEEALNESERKFRMIAENIQDGILTFDQNKKISYVSPSYLRQLGYTLEEELGKDATEISQNVHPDEKVELFARIYSAIALKEPDLIYTYRVKNKSGEYLWREDHATFNYNSRGQYIGSYVVCRDITERKLAEITIQEQNDKLQKINSEKDKFFSIVAHDLRSPFNSFLGLTQIMAEEMPRLTMTQLQEIAVTMSKSATNLYRLLENLLQWSQIQKGALPFNPETIQLSAVVNESIAMNVEQAKTKKIEVTTLIPDDLYIFADNNSIQTVIRNLVSNAVKFTNGGGKVTISAKTSDEKMVEISVQDTGIGMNQTMISNLFRIDIQTSRKGTEGESSTGLGLILCKEFIEKHNGKIWVESEVGKGSSFRFTLPCEPLS